ncbi:ATPase, AAA-type, core [Corchorus capsularis]|uniref:ATPase, AAA-type, core n=1 Tax=Corchorus capsularis TaxID=210143 RepID=A0A1R3GQU7_COCAP|nr:ATPase, AAA-type, core [Corchorus capsularis]
MSIPSTASVLSAYTTFTATVMLIRGVLSEVRAIISQLIPTQLQAYLLSKLGLLFSNRPSSRMTLLIDENDGYSMNELYEASEIYLQTKINPSMERLRVSKGTGKSSLVAAMANYLKFNVYDLELASLYNNSDLRRLLVSTQNRSIVVIEDIDCSIELPDRYGGGGNGQLTLSGLLNFIDGLWSSCGDERIIVFTTNHKDKLDPALLRPGRMDMHIHMLYCTPSGFRVLASNYLDITSHDLFHEIDQLLMEVEATPAELAEELMKSEDVDIALEGLIKFLQNKKLGSVKFDSDGEEAGRFNEENDQSNE